MGRGIFGMGYRAALLGVIALLSTIALHAEEAADTAAEIRSQFEAAFYGYVPERTLSVGLTVADYRYVEPGNMDQAGLMTGVNLTARSAPHLKATVWGAQAEFFKGKLDYDGALSDGQGTIIPFKEKADDYFYNIQGYWGYRAPVLEYRVGLGYWYLNDQGRSKYSYEREQIYYYMPLSIHWSRDVKLSRKGAPWKLLASGEYDFLFAGRNRTHSVGGKGPITNYDQRSGDGSKLALALNKSFGKRTYAVEIYRREWKIGKSDVVEENIVDEFGQGWRITSWEPRNRTAMTGFTFSVTY